LFHIEKFSTYPQLAFLKNKEYTKTELCGGPPQKAQAKQGFSNIYIYALTQMTKIRKNTDYESVPWIDKEEKLLYCCPFCRYNCEYAGDIHYHIIGFHKVLSEFFDDY
jgi:hypothetical protein